MRIPDYFLDFYPFQILCLAHYSRLSNQIAINQDTSDTKLFLKHWNYSFSLRSSLFSFARWSSSSTASNKWMATLKIFQRKWKMCQKIFRSLWGMISRNRPNEKLLNFQVQYILSFLSLLFLSLPLPSSPLLFFFSSSPLPTQTILQFLLLSSLSFLFFFSSVVTKRPRVKHL